MVACFRPGTLLADTYRIVRLVGTGGMGEVYEATHDRLPGRYAVKVLLADIANRTDVIQRFRREAEVTSRLRHPNIVQVLDFNVTEEGYPYLVMEFLEGVELAAEIARVGAMPPARVVDIVGQIASALAAAQSHAIVHRDLKPQNLFLVRLPGENREIVKVVDFGISKVLASATKLTRDTTIMGTPEYMAPEQALGQGALIDERSDEFALAAITYELFTGQRAFQGDSAPSVLYQVVHEEPPPVTARSPRVGPAVDVVVRKGLAKSPEGRYPSALAFHQELVRAVAAGGDKHTVALADAEAEPVRPATALDSPPPATTLGLAAASVDNRAARPRQGMRRTIVLGVAGLAVLAGAVLAFYRSGVAQPTPARLPPLAIAKPVAPPRVETIQVLYSPEKAAWIEAVTADFEKSHSDIRVELVRKRSMAAGQALLDEQSRAAVWTPADSAVLDMFGAEWRNKHGSELFAGGDDARQPLLLTPLVFLAWEDQARVLEKLGGGRIAWKNIRQGTASAKGWLAIGGQARWGTVTVGHTDPVTTNAGLQALCSMWLASTRKLRIDLQDVQSPKSQDFVRGIEKGVSGLEATPDTLTSNMVRFGSSKYDIAVVYEANAIAELANADGRWGKLVVSYPVPTLWSDNPIAILTTTWVTEAQARAGRSYVAYLRSTTAQMRAREFGFRPADTSVKLLAADPNNPFTRFADHGITVEVPPAAPMPDGVVLRSLLSTWDRMLRP